MKKRDLFSSNFVDVVSKIMALFTAFIYALILFYIDISTASIKFILITFLLILSILQFYFFIIRNRKAITLTNVHFSIMLMFAMFSIIKELLINRFYTRDINGLTFFIALILLSIFIINKYKTPKIEYKDLEEIGKNQD